MDHRHVEQDDVRRKILMLSSYDMEIYVIYRIIFTVGTIYNLNIDAKVSYGKSFIIKMYEKMFFV